MGADNPGRVPPQAEAVRALPVALTLRDHAPARKHDTDLSNRLTDQASGLLGRDAVLTIIGLHNAGTLPDCGAPRVLIPFERLSREVRPYRTGWHCAGIRGAQRRVMARPADGYGVPAAGGLRGEEDEQA